MHKLFSKGLAVLALATALAFSAVAPAVAAPGTRVYTIYTYKNIAGAATTVVKSGAGIFHTFCVNTVGTTVVFFDNTAGSGTKIASWTSTALGCFPMDVQFTVGLTAVTVGAGDLTVAFQ